MTGAATTRLDVYMAAPTEPVVATATATSGFPLALIPARTAPHMNPSGMAAAVKLASSVMFLLYQALQRGDLLWEISRMRQESGKGITTR
jgi:hypothetical protein